MKRTIEFPDGIEEKAIQQMYEMEKRDAVGLLNTLCYWLIKQCVETNAETMTITQEGFFSKNGEERHGDWEIIVKKIKKESNPTHKH